MRTDKQPKLAEMAQEVPAREAWRVFGIMAEFVEATTRHYEKRGLEPSPAEREVLLNL